MGARENIVTYGAKFRSHPGQSGRLDRAAAAGEKEKVAKVPVIRHLRELRPSLPLPCPETRTLAVSPAHVVR